MEATFLYGFVALIFGAPFVYFTFRALQRWKRGDILFSTKDYVRLGARLALIVVGAAAASRWSSMVTALLFLMGMAWMWYVERRSSEA